jgi:nucleotide-binding universal stress UspA family protein
LVLIKPLGEDLILERSNLFESHWSNQWLTLNQLVAQAKRRAALHNVVIETSIVAGHEVKSIMDFDTAGDFDLLVIGYHVHSRVYEHLWGGTSQNLARMTRYR